MTKFIIIITLVLHFNTNNNIEWDAIYTNASYALNHTKKALSANNFDHQVENSEKALKSYEKIAKYLELSNDEELKLLIENTISDLEKAVDAPNWDKGRYYSKKVHQSTKNLIAELDIRAESENGNVIPE